MAVPRALRPMRLLRRRAVTSGLLGGSRFWLVAGGAAWVAHWAGRVLGTSDPQPVYTEQLSAGERIVVAHLLVTPRDEKKAARADKRAGRAEKKAARRARRGS